ncbi:MAG: hypothetical protein M1298_00805, partial [Chloroflexi bacterium]|nr:hypothetical protein [Chloroflexota bacterium]
MSRIVALAILLLGLFPRIAFAQSTLPCQFILGFKTLHDLIPIIVGSCLDNEQHNPLNGDAL